MCHFLYVRVPLKVRCDVYAITLGGDFLHRLNESVYFGSLPRVRMRSEGKVISRGWCPGGGVHKEKIYSFFGTNLLSLKILTFRALF